MILGVDCGAKGALALLSREGELIDVIDMPGVEIGTKRRVSAALVAQQIRAWNPRLAVVEQAQSMPKQGVASTFIYGYGAGIIEGVCAAADIPVLLTRPAIWKRAMKVTADKGSSRLMAQRLWPAHAARFALVKDHGRAESCLLCLYGLQSARREELYAVVC